MYRVMNMTTNDKITVLNHLKATSTYLKRKWTSEEVEQLEKVIHNEINEMVT